MICTINIKHTQNDYSYEFLFTEPFVQQSRFFFGKLNINKFMSLNVGKPQLESIFVFFLNRHSGDIKFLQLLTLSTFLCVIFQKITFCVKTFDNCIHVKK